VECLRRRAARGRTAHGRAAHGLPPRPDLRTDTSRPPPRIASPRHDRLPRRPNLLLIVTDQERPHFGGGRADHDGRYIAQALAFLRERAADPGDRPFCLIVSLVNPHDVLAYPTAWADDYTEAEMAGDLELPPTAGENLAANRKPEVDEHELYDLEADPLERENLAHPDHPRYGDPEVAAVRERLTARLAEREAELATSAAAG